MDCPPAINAHCSLLRHHKPHNKKVKHFTLVKYFTKVLFPDIIFIERKIKLLFFKKNIHIKEEIYHGHTLSFHLSIEGNEGSLSFSLPNHNEGRTHNHMNLLQQQLHTLHELGMTYASIAKIAGVDSSVISKYASGKSNSTPETEQKIANAIQTIKEVVTVI